MGQYSVIIWSWGGLPWKELLKRLVHRCVAHKIADRAALLSFYFLVAFFPLLVVLANLIGFLVASETSTYIALLNYLDRIMPPSAFQVLLEWLEQLASTSSGGKISVGAAASLWTASSGLMALIEALNVAFEVPRNRSWGHRRFVAIMLTLALGCMLALALAFLLASDTLARILVERVPVLRAFSLLSGVVRWVVSFALLFASLLLIYSFGPNLGRKRWEGVLPGAVLAMGSWLIASYGLRTYLQAFGPLSHSYGSLGGVMALLFWLYVSGAALVVGGELNAVIWHATGKRT